TEIGRRAIEPVVDHLGDLRASLECAIEHVVIDAILGEQRREGFAVAAFDGVAERAKHGSGVHGVSLRLSCPANGSRECAPDDRLRGGTQYSRERAMNRGAAAHWIVRSSAQLRTRRTMTA